MTFSKAHSPRPARRPGLLRACGLGLALGLAGAGGVPAAVANPAAAVPAATAAQPSGAVRIADIDFRRGEGGAGRLVVRFDGEGAAPDLRNQGASVIVDVGRAELPAELQRSLDVVDFATPVQRVDASSAGGSARVVLSTRGPFESMAYQAGSEYVVEIVPRGAAPAVGAITADTIAAAAQTVAAERGYSGRPVTFNFQDVPVRTVLQLIAEESNLNIVASDTVQGNVTLRLVNVPWDQALDIVLRAKGLDKRREEGVVWVAPQPEIAGYEKAKEDARIEMDNRVGLVTDYIQINYHSATAIYKALTEAKGIGNQSGGAGNMQNEDGFLSQRGRIVADERTNTLMISDIPKKLAQMRELISVIDRPVDQVLIEGRIVIATDSFARELGARFGVSGASGKDGDTSSVGFGSSIESSSANASARASAIRSGSPTFNVTRGAPAINLPVPALNNPGSFALSILNAGHLLDVELSALQTEGRGEVISNPRIVTTNQREGVIRQGREVGYVTMTGGVGAQALPSVEFKDVLLELKVTPTITNDNRVFMAIEVKKDEVLGYIDTSIGEVPEIAKREVNTAVLVEDGQTVVIGGVYEFTDRDSISKVPFLGDVPFLGALFRKKTRGKEKAELLVFITPKVLRVAPPRD